MKKKFNWAYFRKEAADGPFELYSDTSSKLAYLNRFFYLFLFIFFINIFIGIINLTFSGLGSRENITDFIEGVNTGVAIALIYPILKVLKKRKNLKQQLVIFND